MKKSIKVVMTMAVVGLMSLNANAQDKCGGHKCGDGKCGTASKEVKGMKVEKPAMPTFELIDTNKDGKATQEEFDACRADRMKKMVESGQFEKMQKSGMKMNPPSFTDITKDGKDYFTAEEFKNFKSDMMKSNKKNMKEGKKEMKCGAGKCGGGM